jgi:hypothetical protein
LRFYLVLLTFLKFLGFAPPGRSQLLCPIY